MGRYRFHDAGQSSEAEGTRRHTDDVLRRLARSSDQPIKRPSLDERKIAQAIDRGKYKMQKYQQEAERYQDKDRDTFEEFTKNFDNDINLKNYVVGIVSKNSSGKYDNEIDVENGKIVGIDNKHNYQDSEENLDFSEVIFNQICLAMKHLKKDMSKFNLKCWCDDTITNEETINTVKLFFPEEKDKDGSVKEGERKFLAGTDAFIALAGTPTAQSKFYLLAQHPKAFNNKKVKSITVRRQVYSLIDINYEFGS